MAQVNCPKCDAANEVAIDSSGAVTCRKCRQVFYVTPPRLDAGAGEADSRVRHAVQLGAPEPTVGQLDVAARVAAAFIGLGTLGLVALRGIANPLELILAAVGIGVAVFCFNLLRGLADLLRQLYALRVDLDRRARDDGDESDRND